MFGALLRAHQLNYTIATPAQQPLVLKLVHNSRFRLIQFGRTTLALPPAHLRIAVAWHHERPVATLIAATTDATCAWIRCCAIDGVHLTDHEDVLAQLARCLINDTDISTWYYSGDHYDQWLADILVRVGFVVHGGIITLERPAIMTQAIPTVSAVTVLQPLRVSDIPVIQAIDHVVFSAEWHKIPYEVNDLFIDEHYGRLATIDAHVVGYTLAAIHDYHTSFHLVRIAVHPHWQGRGIAKQLLADVIAHAQTLGVHRITLNTQADNYIAQRLYQQFGFHDTGDRYDVYTYAHPSTLGR